jgi:hypothetical protein
MNEARLSWAVHVAATSRGLFTFRLLDSRRVRGGWPDYVIIGRRMIFRELKADEGRLSRDQSRVGELIREAGGDWAVWRPADYNSGLIARELDEIALEGIFA